MESPRGREGEQRHTLSKHLLFAGERGTTMACLFPIYVPLTALCERGNQSADVRGSNAITYIGTYCAQENSPTSLAVWLVCIARRSMKLTRACDYIFQVTASGSPLPSQPWTQLPTPWLPSQITPLHWAEQQAQQTQHAWTPQSQTSNPVFQTWTPQSQQSNPLQTWTPQSQQWSQVFQPPITPIILQVCTGLTHLKAVLQTIF